MVGNTIEMMFERNRENVKLYENLIFMNWGEGALSR